MKLGMLIKEMRLESGLTQRDLAEKMKVDPSTVSYMENNKQRFGFRSVIKFCNAMKIPLWYLIAQATEDRDLPSFLRGKKKQEYMKVVEKMERILNK